MDLDFHGDAFLLLPPFVFPDFQAPFVTETCLKSKPPVWVFFALRFTHSQLEETMRGVSTTTRHLSQKCARPVTKIGVVEAKTVHVAMGCWRGLLLTMSTD